MFWRKSNRARKRSSESRVAPPRLPTINWKRWMPVMAVLLVAGAALFAVRVALDQPIDRIAIEGRFQRVQPLDVEKAVRAQVGRKGLVAVDLDAVGRAVRNISWVDRVSVARSWPRQLRIHVVEQVPVARWGDEGLLNMRGEVFVHDLRHAPTELPVLIGPPGYEVQMTLRYLAAQQRLVEAGLRLSQLRLDERGAWEFALDNGVLLRMGRLQLDERFDRFIVSASGIVVSRATEISYVDMRYANGFAIGWRQGSDEVKRG